MTHVSATLEGEIQRRKLAETALRIAEEQFHQLVAGVEDYAIFLLDRSGNVLSWNEGAERIKGYRPHEIIGQHFSRFYPAAEAEQGEPERILAIAAVQGCYESEGWRLRNDGSQFWANVVITALRDEAGELTGFLKITRDLTERREVQQKLQEANAALQVKVQQGARQLSEEKILHAAADAILRRQTDLLEQSYDPVFVWEWSGPILFWNRAAEEVYGYGKPEAIGKVSHDLLQTRFPHGLRALEQTLQRVGKWAGELTHTTKRGDSVIVESRMSLIVEPEKHLVLETNRDITERKRNDELIRGVNQRLEQLVQTRTAELRDVVQSLQAFTYSVSHDLRAPLRNVQTLAQAMLEDYGDRLDALGREYAHRLIASTRRMDTLIRDLLTYSRLTRAELMLQPVNLSTLLKDLVRASAAEIAERDAEIIIIEPLPTVRANRVSLLQALDNLLSNALKFVAPGVRPRVQLWAEDRGAEARLWIEDNGIGIAAEHQQRVFHVFERLHGEEGYPGTGIGLAIVEKSLERMGGRSGVESTLGHGSRFWLELPKA